MMLNAAATRAPEAMLAFFGAAAHFAIAAAIGWVSVALSRRMPQWAALIATAVALSAWMASEWVFPAALRALTADLSRTQQLVYFIVLAITLWGGIRFAPMGDQAA